MTETKKALSEESEIRKAAKFERNARILRLYYEGLSSGQIGVKIGEKRGTVLAVLNKYGAVKQ